MKNQENILNSWTGSVEKQTVCVCSASSVWVGNCVRVSLTAWVECQMNTSHWHVQSAISSAVVIYELYYMVRVCVCVSKRVCLCVRVGAEVGLLFEVSDGVQRCSCCLHANAAAELEDVGEEGKRPEHAPTNTHTRTITTCHFTPFLVENQNRLDVLMCCCLAAENQEDQTHKHRLIKSSVSHRWTGVTGLLQIRKLCFCSMSESFGR